MEEFPFDHVGKKDTSMFKKLNRFLSSNALLKSPTKQSFRKSKSWHSNSNSREKTKVAPHGCFSVYVGEEKKRFVIKIEFANHPLFKMLLEDAELEYGYNSEGPLLLPCGVDLFCEILNEMDCEFYGEYVPRGSCGPFSPMQRLGSKSDMAKGCSSYGLLTPPPRLLKINHF